MTEKTVRLDTVRLDGEGLPEGFLSRKESFETVRWEMAEDGIGLITLARPGKLNAFDELMIRELRQLVWRANFDEAVRVVVITGEGRGFCSGRDIHGLDYENNLPSPQYRAYVRANHELFDDIEAIEKPVIAMINGICAGGGVEMSVACDFRIASDQAEFLLPEIDIGVIPASGAASRMIQLIGIGRLKEMMMAALPVPAETALHWGLVTRTAPPDGLREATLEFARSLVKRAPLAMGMTKQVINMCQSIDTETGRWVERLGQSVLIQSEDTKEGNAAFREKRKPTWRGR